MLPACELNGFEMTIHGDLRAMVNPKEWINNVRLRLSGKGLKEEI